MLHSLTVSESFPAHATPGSCDVEPSPRAVPVGASVRLLITGDENELAGVLPAIDRAFQAPIHLFDATTIRLLPSFARGTVLIAGVHRLAGAEQNHLFDWLTEHGARHPWIVSTSAASLWPRVENGLFRADLFYKLNLMSVAARLDECLEAIALAVSGGGPANRLRPAQAGPYPR
jgi:hypothetical protein